MNQVARQFAPHPDHPARHVLPYFCVCVSVRVCAPEFSTRRDTRSLGPSSGLAVHVIGRWNADAINEEGRAPLSHFPFGCVALAVSK